ncbi:unnamed protein product [Paramecium octaurelia]|uniref:Uncharacterized protein n=1 Tax=Paramecium octaurelia TaxID=43137 RepID=A0A8S1XJD9_PAROT|nr:unnamed protein product [Paramecium octaurelia]
MIQFNDLRENVMSINQLEQSVGSKAMPKIKFSSKDFDDSDSDEEVKHCK